MKRKINILLVFLFFAFILISFHFKFTPGIKISKDFFKFSTPIFKFMPMIFILLGLFDVWVKREIVEKHLGEESGLKGYFWAIILSSTTVGGLYVCFPIVYSLFKKGARLAVIFTYVGCSGLCRVIMTSYEATFMGLKFTLIRLIFSLPLVILASMFLEKLLKNKNYEITEPSHDKTMQ